MYYQNINMGLKIINYRKLVGTELYGAGPEGATKWKVTTIIEHLRHYVIFVEEAEYGWDRKIVLSKHYETNQTGFQYKLECGTEHMYLVKPSIQSINVFTNYLEYFL